MARAKQIGPKKRFRIRAIPKPKVIVGRDWPNTDSRNDTWSGCRAVCKRCHYAMRDIEPMSRYGEYWHPSIDKDGKSINCVNAGITFDQLNAEVEPFLRKRDRRRNKRNNIRP
jgi:hypothetical protein